MSEAKNDSNQKNKNSSIEETLKSFQQKNGTLAVETDPVTVPPTVVMVATTTETSAGAAVATKGAAKSSATCKKIKEGIVCRLQDLWKDLKRKEFLPIKILNFLMYGGMMVLYPFLTLQARSLGITESELGVVYAFLPVVSLVGPPVAGMIADKIGNFKHFLAAMVFVSGLACLLYMAVPVGRIHHRMPDVLPVSLSCSGTNFVSQLKTLDKLECDYEDIIEPVDVLISSCTSQCSMMRSAIENDRTLSTQFVENLAEEPITISDFRHRLAKASPETNFNLSAIDEAFQAEVRGVLGSRTLVLTLNVCPSLNERLRLWLNKNQNPRSEESVASSLAITPSLAISSGFESPISSGSKSVIPSPSKSAISSTSESSISSTSKSAISSTSKSPIPSTSKSPIPSTSEPAIPSTSKSAIPSTSKSTIPSTSKSPIPSTSKSAIPSTSKSAIPSTSKSAISSASKSTPSSLVPTTLAMETISLSPPSPSPEGCTAQCRVLVVREGLCKNKVSVEDIAPQLTFWVYVVVRLLNSVTLASSMPLFEGAVMTILKQYNGDFGFQKLYASLGPLVLTPLSGVLIDAFSPDSNTQDYRPAFYVYIAIKFLCAGLIFLINLEFKPPSKRVIKDFRSIMTNFEICCFLLMCFMAGVSHGAMDTFLFWLLQDMGASKSLMGLTLTVGNLCSLPILLFASPIIKYLGPVNTIILGYCFYVVRFMGYSLIYNPWLSMPFEALECFTMALMLTAAMTYTAELSTATTTATILALVGGLHHGVGPGAGSLAGGFLMTAVGVREMYQVMAVVAAAAAVLYFVVNRVCFRPKERKRRAPNEVQKSHAIQQTVTDDTNKKDVESCDCLRSRKHFGAVNDNLAYVHSENTTNNGK